ncbi:G2/mitotic-specific cyclin-B2-like [Hippocampus zosterae]|uniref:G2/mitotic-specific cyclin-B2-like n=1 Tax=Hippocampus zosterae TaxID=109293 RepID=UPI00223E3B81|nr:G2/mitotic-specific cyclin-B2-like [Hippocampus zosterae]
MIGNAVRKERLSLHARGSGVTDRVFGRDISNLERRVASKDHRAHNKSYQAKALPRAPPNPIAKNNSLLEKFSQLLGNPSLTPSAPASNRQPKGPLPQPPPIDELAMLRHLQAMEPHSRASTLHPSSNITEAHRCHLAEWLIEVHTKLRLKQATLFMMFGLLDRVLVGREVRRSKLQLVGMVCLLAAAKFQETYRVPTIKDLLYLCASCYSRQEVLDEEGSVLELLGFELHEPTAQDFLHLLAGDMEDKELFLVSYVLELALVKHEFSGYRASLLTAAAVFLINKIRSRPPEANQQLLSRAGFGEADVRAISK